MLDGTQSRVIEGNWILIFLLVLVPYLPLLSSGPNQEFEEICNYPNF
jgi:hypothetical protein